MTTIKPSAMMCLVMTSADQIRLIALSWPGIAREDRHERPYVPAMHPVPGLPGPARQCNSRIACGRNLRLGLAAAHETARHIGERGRRQRRELEWPRHL